jgi:hypothetical protein
MTRKNYANAVAQAIDSVFGTGSSQDYAVENGYVIPVSDDESEQTAEALRQVLPDGWQAEWTGCGNTDQDGHSTSDLRVSLATG